jgi:hypothetical protein
MSFISKLTSGIQAARELGYVQVGLFGLYQVGLRSGYYRKVLASPPGRTDQIAGFSFRPVWELPQPAKWMELLDETIQSDLIAEADEIVSGYVRLFGGQPRPLNLTPQAPLTHWTEYELHSPADGAVNERQDLDMEAMRDIKFIWEPARFGWAYRLGQAYLLSKNERYAEVFWQYAETFLQANPPYQGPNWVSAQEAALRIIAFTFALQIFSESLSTSSDRRTLLVQSIAEHARRIPPTLIYARAQNNNHLLSEAVGLYTAGICLPDHPDAPHWRDLGWRWFLHGLETQIQADGCYTQHSSNYHRLALQLGLWFVRLAQVQGQSLPETALRRLALATRWLSALVDPVSGRTPNLGPNDGANIFPLSSCTFSDYRPLVQAASKVFLGKAPLPAGRWDELGLWLNIVPGRVDIPATETPSPHIIRQAGNDRWAYLRVASFKARPGHADQLHVDLWWHGLNIAQDAGTYLYNAPPPWENALTHTAVHNTLLVDDQEQMRRAGRFLYLNRAQAEVIAGDQNADGWSRIVARHDGYRSLGVYHERSVAVQTDGMWVIEDTLASYRNNQVLQDHNVRLHWLLPDWLWQLEDASLILESPFGEVVLSVSGDADTFTNDFRIRLDRAGELLHGSGPVQPTWGWVSPTYGEREPALSFSAALRGSGNLRLISRWKFPDMEPAQ